MNVFLSYTTRDGLLNRSRLREVARHYENRANIYVDLLEHRCGGHQPSVWRALSSADLLVVCVTPGVFASPWVQLELDAARMRALPMIFRSPKALLRAPQLTPKQ